MKRSTFPIALIFTVLLAASAWAVPARSPSAARPAPLPPATYQVKKGDSLYAIGRRTGLTVQELKRLNGLKGTALKPGQVLLLEPKRATAGGKSAQEKPSAASASPAGGTRAAATYQVRKGDSLYAIARRNGLTVQELKRLNGLKGNALKPGQKLMLARAASSAPPPAIAAGPDPAKLLREESVAQLPEEERLISQDTLEEVAFSYLATPYRFGGSGNKGIDCSNFVRSVFRELNIDLPRTAREQYRLGTQVDPDELQSGDLLFFRTYAKYPSHVGIYLGDHKMIHASPRSRRVVITNVDAPYFRSRFIGAKRLALLTDALNLEALSRDVEEEPEPLLAEEIDPVATSGDN
ncbi:MAG TPA: LysM peptidoglycan-binding domain-containing protein [Desulfuromonadales bacterium]|nr:LysM peptidoglycan-binding domain-containing protein [Desulfuromonadales bacterium]